MHRTWYRHTWISKWPSDLNTTTSVVILCYGNHLTWMTAYAHDPRYIFDYLKTDIYFPILQTYITLNLESLVSQSETDWRGGGLAWEAQCLPPAPPVVPWVGKGSREWSARGRARLVPGTVCQMPLSPCFGIWYNDHFCMHFLFINLLFLAHL